MLQKKNNFLKASVKERWKGKFSSYTLIESVHAVIDAQ